MKTTGLAGLLSDQPLLALTIAAILVAVAAQMIASASPRLAAAMRIAGHCGLALALVLTVGQSILRNRLSEAALWTDRVPAAQVIAGETVIPRDALGQFRVAARIDGTPVTFLIDSGATYTAISQQVAQDLALGGNDTAPDVMLKTANGTVAARFAKAGSLTFGSIRVDDPDVIVLPRQAGETNVIGMNILSRLAGWRVDDGRLILTPARR